MAIKTRKAIKRRKRTFFWLEAEPVYGSRPPLRKKKNSYHVLLRDAFSDARHERNFGLHGFNDGGSSKWWWYVDDRRVNLDVVAGLYKITSKRWRKQKSWGKRKGTGDSGEKSEKSERFG